MVAPPVVSDLKVQLNIPASDTSQDAELGHYLNAATKLIEDKVGPFATTAYTETIAARGNGLNLSHRPIVSITSLAPLLNTWPSFTSTDVSFDARAGTVWRKDLGTLAGAWTVSYSAGWAGDIQENWFLAVLITADFLWRTQTGGGVGVPGMGGEEETVVPGYGYRIPDRALVLVEDSIFYGGIA